MTYGVSRGARDGLEYRNGVDAHHRPLWKWLALSRWQEWYTSKLPYLSVAALFLAPPDTPFQKLLSMLGTVALLAAFGYAINEVADQDTDLSAGKSNRAVGLPGYGIGAFLSGTAIAAVGLTFTWAVDPIGVALVGGVLVLATAYSLHPFRLKERGILGVIAGAGAQWVVPVFALSMSQPDGWHQLVAWLLAALGLAIGVRYMGVHQLIDASADRRATVRTYAATGGNIQRLIVAALAAEVALLLGVLIISWPLSFPAFIALVPWGIQELIFGSSRGHIFNRLQSYDYAPLSEYYFFLLPVALAIGRATFSPHYLVVVFILLILGWCYLQMMVGEWHSLLKRRVTSR